MVNLGYQEQFNNLTGDIELNPSSFGLFMRDIDEAALNLKTAIYSGNINLTADLYKQAEQMAEKKYSLVTTNGQISGNQLSKYYLENGVVKEIDMTGKNPGLYMDHMRMGYWSGTNRKAIIKNTGEMFLGSVLDTNYLYWSGSVLTIKGNLILTNGQTVQEAIDDIDVSWDGLSGKPSVLSLAALSNPTPSGSGLFISSTHMGYYSGGQWKTYMQSNGNFGLSGSGSNYLSWNGTTLVVRGNINGSTITGSTFKSSNYNGSWGVDSFKIDDSGAMFTGLSSYVHIQTGAIVMLSNTGGGRMEAAYGGLYLSSGGQIKLAGYENSISGTYNTITGTYNTITGGVSIVGGNTSIGGKLKIPVGTNLY